MEPSRRIPAAAIASKARILGDLIRPVVTKNRFQEWVQATFGSVLPKYMTERVGGPDQRVEQLERELAQLKLQIQTSSRAPEEPW